MLVFVGYRTIIAQYVAKWGIAQMGLCETKYQGGVPHHFGGAANLPGKVSRDMGYRSDSITISRDMGPLSPKASFPDFWQATKEYLNQRGTKIRVFLVLFCALFLPPFSPHFPPSFPFKPCSLFHNFSPLNLPLFPPFLTPGKLRFSELFAIGPVRFR